MDAKLATLIHKSYLCTVESRSIVSGRNISKKQWILDMMNADQCRICCNYTKAVEKMANANDKIEFLLSFIISTETSENVQLFSICP